MPLSSNELYTVCLWGVRISGMSYHMQLCTVLIHLIRWLISLHYITFSKHSEVRTTKDLSSSFSSSSSSSWSWSSRRMLTKQHRNKVVNIVGDLSISRSWYSFPLICSLSYVYPVNPFKWENYVNRKIRKIVKRKAAKNQFQFSFSRWLRKFIEL